MSLSLGRNKTLDTAFELSVSQAFVYSGCVLEIIPTTHIHYKTFHTFIYL